MALASGSEQFRVPKTSSEETGLVNDTVPPSTKYKNKWAVNIFAEWQSLREVRVPVLDCSGLFKDYTIYTRLSLWAQILPEWTVCRYNFVMEVAKKSGGRYPPCGIIVVSIEVVNILYSIKAD